MPEVRIHDNVAARQFEMRIYFLEEEDRWVVGNFFPYGLDRAAALAAAIAAAHEAARRLKIPWVRGAESASSARG